MSYIGSAIEGEVSRLLREHEAHAFRLGLVLGGLCGASLVALWVVDGWPRVLMGIAAGLVIANTLFIAAMIGR